MAVPGFQDMMLPILQIAEDGKELLRGVSASSRNGVHARDAAGGTVSRARAPRGAARPALRAFQAEWSAVAVGAISLLATIALRE